MRELRPLAALVAKDLRLDWRERSGLWMQAGFTVSAGVLAAAAAFYSESPGPAVAAAGVVVSVFLALFTGYSSFIREAQLGTLDGLRASTAPRWVIVAAKTLYSLALLYPQLLAYVLVARAFTPGLDVAWGAYALWAGAASLFLASASAFVSAALSFGDAGAGPVALTVLALSVPYLKTALQPLEDCMAGAWPEPGSLAGLWLAALSFAAAAAALGEYVLE